MTLQEAYNQATPQPWKIGGREPDPEKRKANEVLFTHAVTVLPKLIEALEFYAQAGVVSPATDDRIYDDCGDKARAALAEATTVSVPEPPAPTPRRRTIYDRVAKQLRQIGVSSAEVWDTGGNIECVSFTYGPHAFLAGTANETWGADVYASEAALKSYEQPIDAIDTDVSSYATNAITIAAALALAAQGFKPSPSPHSN